MDYLFGANNEIDRLKKRIANLGTFNSEDSQKLYILIFYMKIMNHYKAINLLLENNLLIEAGAILRVATETSFISRYMVLDFEDAYRRLEISLNENYRKLFNRIKNNPSYKSIRKNINLDDYIVVPKSKIKETGFEEWAKISKMKNTYDFTYRETSNFIHTGLGVCQDYLVMDEDKRILGFQDPNDSELEKVIRINAVFLVYESMADISMLFEIDISSFGEIIEKIGLAVKNS